jgi:hypothetical protein
LVNINKARLAELIRSIFTDEIPEIFEAYSEYGCELETFESPVSLEEYLFRKLIQGRPSCGFGIWYPSCGGRVEKERIQLNPEACNGHRFRYSVGGWGLFQLQFDFKHDPLVGCRIAVNSEKRASKWESIYHEWNGVETWNWRVIEKHERRLMRTLRSLV